MCLVLLVYSVFFADEENTTEHTPTHHMLQPPQAVFPACICAAVLPIVHLMEDGEVREDGVAGEQISSVEVLFYICMLSINTSSDVSPVSAVAQQILWNCLIEDPALVLRHFLEKLTVSNRQVGGRPNTPDEEKLRLLCLMRRILVIAGRADVHAEEAAPQHRRSSGADVPHPLQLPGEPTNTTCSSSVLRLIHPSSPHRWD